MRLLRAEALATTASDCRGATRLAMTGQVEIQSSQGGIHNESFAELRFPPPGHFIEDPFAGVSDEETSPSFSDE